MSYLRSFLKEYTVHSILAPLFKMLEAMFDLCVPLVVAKMIDTGIAGGHRGYVLRCCLILILLALVGLVCSFVAQYFAAKAATGSAAGMRRALFSHIQKLSPGQVDTIGTSTLITRMVSDISQVQNGINLFLRLFLRSPFIVFGAMIMAFTIHFRAALIFTLVIPVLSVIVFGIMRITAPRYRHIQAGLDDVTRLTRENLSGVRVIRAFGKEGDETSRFRLASNTLFRRQIGAGRLSALTNPLTCVVINLGIVAILYTGGGAVAGGVLLRGDVIALVNYMSQILVELVKLANLIVTLSKASASLNRVSAVLDIAPDMAFGTQVSGDSGQAVAFQSVCLTYPGAGGESLTDISFTVSAGETVGIIGGTGSGKSSIVSLIDRFYDATSGQVLLQGIPVKDWEKSALRRTVSIVPQRAQLFSGTIRSNLMLGNGEADDDALWHALEIAQAADFVREKPGMLDAPVEQGGRNFSGGQKQRLTIARALVCQPRILILDDSASALDLATDAALRKALASLPRDITVFIVSQRTSSLRHADQILVLEDGRLAGRGDHNTLMDTCPVYREIHESQFRKEAAK